MKLCLNGMRLASHMSHSYTHPKVFGIVGRRLFALELFLWPLEAPVGGFSENLSPLSKIY